MAGSAAERQPSDAGCRDDAEGNGEAEGMCSMIDIPRCAARRHAHGAVGRVYTHAFHHRQVDHETIVDGSVAWAVVTATPNRDRQLLLPAEVHGGDDIGDVNTASDQQGPLVYHGVV